MLLVFIFIAVFFLLVLLLSEIQIKVNYIKISNMNNKRKFCWDYLIKLELYLFSKIKLFDIPIYKEKFEKSKRWNKLKKEFKKKKDWSFSQNRQIIEQVKKVKPNIDKFSLNLCIGTEDVVATSFAVAFIASSIGIFMGQYIPNFQSEKHYYQINPIYKNENVLDLRFSCIIKAKLVHIIYVIYMFSKKRSDKKHEPASNRRSYDYSYE